MQEEDILQKGGRAIPHKAKALGFLRAICMKTADDKILTGWLASQTDMLSIDWTIAG